MLKFIVPLENDKLLPILPIISPGGKLTVAPDTIKFPRLVRVIAELKSIAPVVAVVLPVIL